MSLPRSLRSDTIGRRKRQTSVSSLRKVAPIRLADPFLESQLSVDDSYMNVLWVREELIENALDQCMESYIKRQTVTFLVDCLHKAFINVINTVYMHYDTAVIDATIDLWSSDEQFQPLPLDNFCEFSVPFVTKAEVVSSVDINISIGQDEVYTSQIPLPSLVSAGAAESEVAEAEDEMEMSEVSELDVVVSESCTDSLQFDETISSYMFEASLSEKEEAKAAVACSTTELYEDITSQTSFFTVIAEANNNFLPPIEQLRCDNNLVKTGELQSSRSNRTAFSPDVKKHTPVGLPPLRLKAKFKPSEMSRSNVRFGRSLNSLDKFNMQSKSTAALREDEDSNLKFEESEETQAIQEKKAFIPEEGGEED